MDDDRLKIIWGAFNTTPPGPVEMMILRAVRDEAIKKSAALQDRVGRLEDAVRELNPGLDL